jgi:hypothetical protein
MSLPDHRNDRTTGKICMIAMVGLPFQIMTEDVSLWGSPYMDVHYIHAYMQYSIRLVLISTSPSFPVSGFSAACEKAGFLLFYRRRWTCWLPV